MTHADRAEEAARIILAGEFPENVKAERYVGQVIWRAIVEGCNDELQRRRAVEDELRRALRLVGSLEASVARLEKGRS